MAPFAIMRLRLGKRRAAAIDCSLRSDRWRGRVRDHKLVAFAALLAVIGGALWLHRRPSAPMNVAATPEHLAAHPAAAPNEAPPGSVNEAASRQAADSLDDRSFIDVRAELERRAEGGDARAAARLGRVFAMCNGYVASSEAQIETAVIELSALGVTMSEGHHALDPDALLARAKAGRAQQERNCAHASGVNEKDASSLAFRWTAHAAALGDADAQALYGGLAFADYSARSAIADAEQVRDRKHLAREYLERSLAGGDALALMQMYANYRSGTLFAPDAEAAYRYLYAYSLTPRAVETAPEAMALLLDEASSALDDAARERARSEAASLAACCMAPVAP
jgi:hypothetical protein